MDIAKIRNNAIHRAQRLRVKIQCATSMHDWTCAVDEGIPATRDQIAAGVDGFFDYAKMYCKRCGHVYQPNKR